MVSNQDRFGAIPSSVVSVNDQIFIVDREDQVKWYLSPLALSFYIQIRDNHREIRDWLADMTTNRVVISAQGKLPRRGTEDHPTLSIYEHVYKDRYRVYFEDERDAMLFKLTWGGDL